MGVLTSIQLLAWLLQVSLIQIRYVNNAVLDCTLNDPNQDTWYLTSKTYIDQSLNGATGRPNGRYYVHAISTVDLSERPNFPVNLEGMAARNNPIRSFNGGIHHQRPALLHTGDYVYAGFASHWYALPWPCKLLLTSNSYVVQLIKSCPMVKQCWLVFTWSVQWNFTGWIVGWHKGTGQLVERFATECGKLNASPTTLAMKTCWR